jgi:UDP-glucuronate 4-epimerase
VTLHVAITGAAGFVGSHLCEAALAAGHTVVGIDCLTDYYDVSLKKANITALQGHPDFEFADLDLQTADLLAPLDGAEVIHHLAGQPGVRMSWSDGFVDYVGRNVLATQRLLEAARITRPRRFVQASSSSVYGNAAVYPTTEQVLPRPHSPYGVTKLAAEHLCGLYAANWGVPTTSLRYFTVYGPRQRPDMGMHRFLAAAARGESLPIYGDGEQVRDFTFVGDVVAANLAAGHADLPPGTVMNIAGGGAITVNELVEVLGEVVGHPLAVERLPEQAGDVRATAGAIDLAEELLGWRPQVGVADGLAAQWEWLQHDPAF